MSVASQSSSWPGERDPSHQDVASANELPDPTFLFAFKRNLMSSGDAAGSERLFHINLKNQEPIAKKYTYPLGLLSNFPRLPTDDHLAHLSQIFSKRCLSHVFFDHFPIPTPSREPIAPALRFGISCLALVCDRGDMEEARNLFSAGTSLWFVMVEVDNRLARSVEMLLAAILLIPYGVLAATEPLQRVATAIMSSSFTICRRMRLHDPGQLGTSLGQRISSFSPLLWSLWLWDVLHAVHLNLSLNFSPNELLSKAPSSTHAFQDVYRNLLQESSAGTQSILLTMDNSSRELAVLLLLAILSDSITIHRSLGSAVNLLRREQNNSYRHNPFVPLSAYTELERMKSQLSIALDRWYDKFKSSMSPAIIALYHYSRLYLSCPAIPTLTQVAQHEASSLNQISVDTLNISARSVSHAWAVLDVAATCPHSEEGLYPAWMPIVVFHAALVVWANIKFSTGSDSEKHGSVRALLAFKVELEAMPWPSCTNMARILQNLMSS